MILDTLPATKYRKEIDFRLVGEDAVMVEYGRIPPENYIDYMDIFRTMAVTAEVERRKVTGFTPLEGFLEVTPSFRTAVYRFDPRVKSIESMIGALKDIEEAVGDSRDIAKMEFNSPVIERPLHFEDSRIQEANERYLKEFKPNGSVDVDPVYMDNMTYVADYCGISREECKEKVLSTEWLSCLMSFMVGSCITLPLDRRCTIRSCKCNPPRTWCPRGGVCFVGFVLSEYLWDGSAGGGQLIGRTSQAVDPSQNHSSFKEDIALTHRLDRIRWYEVDEAELLRIEKAIDEGSSDFIYKKTPGRFSVGEWLEFEQEHKAEIDAWLKKIDEAAARAPVP